MGNIGHAALRPFLTYLKGFTMKRLLLALIFGFVLGSVVFAQAPAQAPVEFRPIVNFDKVIEVIRLWFTDILKEYWVTLLTFFVVWFALMCALSFLEGKFEGRMARVKAEVKRQDRVEQKVFRAQERQEGARLARQQEIERTGYIAAFESEYSSRELQNLVFRDHENLVMIDNKRYVREMTSEGDIIGQKTFDEWRKDRDKVEDESLSFDNDDHGRKYVNGVAVDEDDEPGYWWFKDSHLRSLEKDEDDYDSETFEDRVCDWVDSDSSFEKPVSSRSKRERYDSGFDDESEYANPRGSFRGGY